MTSPNLRTWAAGRLLHSIVLATIVLGLLAPDLSGVWRWWHAGGQPSSLWVQVCSASGSRWMLMSADEAPGARPHAGAGALAGAEPLGAAGHPPGAPDASGSSLTSDCELSFWMPALGNAALQPSVSLADWEEDWHPSVIHRAWPAPRQSVSARAPPLRLSA